MIYLDKFRFRIGDTVVYKGNYYQVMAYYFIGEANNFGQAYGYTIDCPCHNGSSFSFNEKGEHISFEAKTVYYVREKEVNPIKEKEKEMNIAEILKDVPKGTKLYSTVHGYVKFKEIDITDSKYPIMVYNDNFPEESFTEDGRYYDRPDTECILFPSKEQRDWSKFKTDLPEDTTVVVFDKPSDINDAHIRPYKGNGTYKSVSGECAFEARYIIPWGEVDIKNGRFVFDNKNNYGSKRYK